MIIEQYENVYINIAYTCREKTDLIGNHFDFDGRLKRTNFTRFPISLRRTFKCQVTSESLNIHGKKPMKPIREQEFQLAKCK